MAGPDPEVDGPEVDGPEVDGPEVDGPEVDGPEVDGVVRWRCVDLQRVIKERFKVTLAERTVAKLLHQLGLSRLTPRPLHPRQVARAQENFKTAWSAT